MQGQNFTAALIVVVRQNASAYSRQRSVTAYEIVREFIDKIDEVFKRLSVDVHRNMLAVYRNSVLVKISVGGILPEPRAHSEHYRNRAEVALVSRAEALVFAADYALRKTAVDAVALRRLFRVAEFGLSLVYGYGQPVRRVEARIFVQHRFFDVLVVYAVVEQPVGRRLATLRFADIGKTLVDLGGKQRKLAVDGVLEVRALNPAFGNLQKAVGFELAVPLFQFKVAFCVLY